MRRRVLDGEGRPMRGQLVEIWQGDENGQIPQDTGSLVRDGHTFTGWGRADR
jgi:protocatechuate 3,4-dioxygenase, alpha subunit